MTEQKPFRLCLVGLPATGKTTFIAALWSYLTSGPPDGAYRIIDYPPDPSYLNAIAHAWAAGDVMPRSSLAARDRIEFTITTPQREHLTVVLPDLPGEVFLNCIIRPWIEEDVADALSASDLVLLFVNAETAKTYSALGDHQPPLAAGTEPRPNGESGEASPPDTGLASQGPSVFAIEDLDSDTLNTELLQRLSVLFRDRSAPPIVLVVSAWDAFADFDQVPKSWLFREQPMLSQYLAEVARTTQVGIVGVSAQGASYKTNPEIVQKRTVERPWATGSDGSRQDIAHPLVWYDLARGLGDD